MLHTVSLISSSSAACAITDPEDDTIIVTGGQYSPRLVTRYDASGTRTRLAKLNAKRGFHGCGSYRRSSDNKLVIN